MPAREYRIGSADERYIKDMAERAGHLAVRAAGSHGTDVIVFTAHGTYACDVKRNDWAPPASRMVMAGWLDHNVWPMLVCVESGAGRKRRVLWREVLGDGSMGMPTDVPPWEWES